MSSIENSTNDRRWLTMLVSRPVGLCLGLVLGLAITALAQSVLGGDVLQTRTYRPETGIIIGIGVFGRMLARKIEQKVDKYLLRSAKEPG